MSTVSPQPFYTIGHSTLALDAFIGLLTDAGVQRVVDIRKLPGSRAQPQFDGPVLARALAEHAVAYEHEAALGGLRGRSAAVGPEVNAQWRNRSFHNYADYALSAPFRQALARLIDTGQRQRSALMCAEAVWWRCHRRIVVDHLLAHGQTVFHILARGRLEAAQMTPGARVLADRSVVYPAQAA